MGANAYAVTNLLDGLAVGTFTFSAGANDATRARLNDRRMDKRYVNGASVSSGLVLVIDIGSAAQPTTGLALLNTNCAVQKADAAVRVRGATDSGITTSIVTAKAATTLNSSAPYNKDHVLQWSSITKRYLEVLFTWTGNVTNFAIGEIIVFTAQTQLTRKYTYGRRDRRAIKSAKVDFYSGGSRGYRLGGPVRSRVLPYADLTAAEAEELALLHSTVGETTPFLFIESYEATATAAANAEQEVLYGKLQTADFELIENDFALYSPNELTIESLGREIGS